MESGLEILRAAPSGNGFRRLRIWLTLGAGLAAFILILGRDYSWTIVSGESMRPTFNTGDFLLVRKRAGLERALRRGDVVVARHRGELIVKRVIGVPGDEVQLDTGRLWVNGAPVVEDYGVVPGPLTIGKGRLAKSKFALLGDNRAIPRAQLVHAIVSKEQILGTVVFSIRFWMPPPPEDTDS